MMRLFVLLSSGLAALASAKPAVRRHEPAPLIRAREDVLVPGKYIVKLRDALSVSAADDTISLLGQGADFTYNITGFRGFAGALDAPKLDSLQYHPDVEYIEQDARIETKAYTTQPNAPWGLARISHRAAGGAGYVYDTTAGQGTCSYIIDTGIYVGHNEFEGRATNLADFTGEGAGDANGHGTHVAGIVGSRAYGVAKKTTLYGIKVLGGTGSGTTAGVIAGVNFVATDAAARCPSHAVSNMSIGGAFSASLNSAVAALVASGVFVAVAAGDGATNVANYSPASVASACTVAASNIGDAMPTNSNYGAGIDVQAPGTNIISTWIGSPDAVATLSGSSMAAAHVTGLAAYLIALEGPRGGEALCERIKEISNQGILTGVPSGTANRLVFNGNPTG